MKVLAIDCYQEKEHISSRKILDAFIEGTVEKGAEVENIVLNTLSINKCLKCTEALDFLAPEHHCTQNDDMNDIYPYLMESDI